MHTGDFIKSAISCTADWANYQSVYMSEAILARGVCLVMMHVRMQHGILKKIT